MFRNKIYKEEIGFKAGAFADDVGALCGGDSESVKRVFMQYEKLTRKSGLVLNADKTEILVLKNNIQREYDITYFGEELGFY